LIIDGYNLLGAMGLPPGQVVGQGESHRDQLIIRLGLYAQTRQCPVTIIFDAWRQIGQVRQIQHQAGVTVMYSGQGERADQVIQQLIRTHGKETAVVSSDHEIADVALACGAFVIKSQEFLGRLKVKGGQRGQAGHPKGGEQGNVDEGEISTKPKDKKGNPKKLPKRLRQRNRIMKRF